MPHRRPAESLLREAKREADPAPSTSLRGALATKESIFAQQEEAWIASLRSQ
jgi:hypothetical protein